MRLWVNGALVRENMVKRKHVADSELVPVQLRAGVTRVLLKIDQTGGGWAFSARIVEIRRGTSVQRARRSSAKAQRSSSRGTSSI